MVTLWWFSTGFNYTSIFNSQIGGCRLRLMRWYRQEGDKGFSGVIFTCPSSLARAKLPVRSLWANVFIFFKKISKVSFRIYLSYDDWLISNICIFIELVSNKRSRKLGSQENVMVQVVKLYLHIQTYILHMICLPIPTTFRRVILRQNWCLH